MAFNIKSTAQFGDMFCVIAEAPIGAEHPLRFGALTAVGSITPRQFFCDAFDYLGHRINPGDLTTDLTVDRPAGINIMRPVRVDQPSHYLTAWRTGQSYALYGNPSVNTNRAVLAPGGVYMATHQRAVLVAIGAVRVTGPLTVRDYTAPAIIDCRFGADSIEALTDATICEVWV